jgi:exosortase
MMVSAAAPPVRDPSAGPTLRSAAVGVATAAAAVLVFLPVMAGLGRQWYEDPNATYGALVAMAVVVATRQRWPLLRVAPPRGSWWGGVALVGASALYVAATLVADVFLLRLSFVAFLAAVLWFVCGTAWIRTLAAPLAMSLVAIPLPGAVVTELTLPLQLAASQSAAGMLNVIGIDAMRDGNLLTLSYITLEVTEACSGMRSVVTLMALLAVYCGTMRPPLARGVVLALAIVPVAIAGNALRVVFTALLASRIGEAAVRGVVHDATGFGAFLGMGAALAGVSLLASRHMPSAGVRS